MTEKEKLAEGELYNSDDTELVNERIRAKKFCADYNTVPYNDFTRRERILSQLLGLKGENCRIEANFFCDYGYNIIVGDNFYSNHNCVFLDCAEIVFGDNVFVGPNCGFYTAEHPFDAETRNKRLERAKPIKIGDNVWIGGNVCVLPGVTIGNNSVIGAGSVVNRDIPDNVVAAGNPCRVIRKIDEKAGEKSEEDPGNDNKDKTEKKADEKNGGKPDGKNDKIEKKAEKKRR